MTISRRDVLLGGAASAALLPLATPVRAQAKEVVIGVIYPLSGASAQIGVDAQKAFETAADIINKDYDCLLYTSPSPRDGLLSRMPSSA